MKRRYLIIAILLGLAVFAGRWDQSEEFSGNYTVATIPTSPATDDIILITDGDAACDTSTGAGAVASFHRWSGAAWVCIGDGGAAASQLDGLSDVTGEGSSGYLLKDDGDGTYSFINDATFVPLAGDVIMTGGLIWDDGSGQSPITAWWNQTNEYWSAFIDADGDFVMRVTTNDDQAFEISNSTAGVANLAVEGTISEGGSLLSALYQSVAVVSDADADPTVNDDIDGSPTAATPDVSGYSVGDIYVNGTASPPKYFVCVDNSNGAADWDQLNPEQVTISSNGLLTRTGAGSAEARTITGTANEVTVTNGDGVSGNPTISLPSEVGLVAKGIELSDNSYVKLDATADGMDDDEYNGVTIGGRNCGETLTQWDLVEIVNDADPWHKADATAASGEYPAFGMAVAACTDTNEATILVKGIVRNEGWTGLTPGAPIYLGETDGTLTETAPSTANDCVQIVGWALSDSEIYFDFSRPYQLVE